MTTPSLEETLRKLASDHESRSESARLRAVYADVELALEKGVSRKAVLETLHADGFTMSLKMFDKALYRIRMKKRGTVTSKPLVSTEADPVTINEPPLVQPSLEVDKSMKKSGAESNPPHPFAHLSERNNPDWKHDGRVHNSVPDRSRIYEK